MKTLTKATLAAVSFLALAGTAYAATDSSQWPSFSQIDKNNDGVLEKKEAKSAKGLDFKSADTDNDGKISQTEYQTAMLKGGQDAGSSNPGSTDSGSGMGGSSSSPSSSPDSGMGTTSQPTGR